MRRFDDASPVEASCLAIPGQNWNELVRQPNKIGTNPFLRAADIAEDAGNLGIAPSQGVWLVIVF